MTDNRTAKEAFLIELRKTYSVSRAAIAAEIARSTAYEWRKLDEQFAADWDAALEHCRDELEASLFERATVGVTKPVFHKGELVGHVQEYSDTAAIFLLKGGRPERYRERHELSGPSGGPIETHNRTEATVEVTTNDVGRAAEIAALLARVGALPGGAGAAGRADDAEADEVDPA